MVPHDAPRRNERGGTALNHVAIVGAGPAGATVALLLARAGVAVTIVERAQFPRRKVCGEYLGAGALAALDRIGLGEAVRARAHPLEGLRLSVAGAPAVELRFPRPAAALSRDVLDALLLDAAVAAGATLVHARAEGMIVEGGRAAGVRLRADTGELRALAAAFTVGADGIGSIVARKLGLVRPPARRARYAIGGHYRGFDGLGTFLEMYAGDGAYFALNPLSEDAANVMLVVRKGALARWSSAIDEGIAGKAAELADGRRDFAGATRLGARVSIGPLDHRVTRTTAPGALLAGDAAGFVNPFTGQGVYLALTGAERAASALQHALETPASEAKVFAAYDRATRRELAGRGRLAAAVDALVGIPFLARRAARRLQRRPAVAAAFVDALAGTAPAGSALRPAVLGRLLL